MTDQHRRRLAPALVVLVVLASLVALLAPSTAHAHGGASAPAATDARALVVSVAPSPAGLRVVVVDGDRALWVAAPGARRLLVLGFANEPFLRLVDGVVSVNDRSPEAHASGLADRSVPIALDADAPPRWRVVGDADHLEWHDHRLATPLGTWRVSLVVGSVPVEVAGVELRGEPPPLVAYLAAILALFLVAGALPWPGALAGVAWAAMLVSAVGGGLAGPHTVAAQVIAIVAVASVAAATAAVLAATPARYRPWVAGGTGAASAFLASAQLAVLAKPYVNSAIPADLARLLVVAAIGTGLGALGGALRSRPWRAW